jgi:hypothetical protein
MISSHLSASCRVIYGYRQDIWGAARKFIYKRLSLRIAGFYRREV